jgi:hypothetical protein
MLVRIRSRLSAGKIRQMTSHTVNLITSILEQFPNWNPLATTPREFVPNWVFQPVVDNLVMNIR